MKRFLKLLLLVVAVLLFKGVNAANYELRELIPVDIKTNVIGEQFRYKGIYYDGGKSITIENVENKTDTDRYASISIGLFDEDKKNIGTINYCSKSEDEGKKLKYREQRPVDIEITKDYLVKGKKVKDIKYISVLSDNPNCRTDGSQEYEGQTVEKIGLPKNTLIDNDSQMLITIILVIVVVLVILFVYQFLFTNRYKNMDGEDVRQEFSYINKEKRLQREYDARVNPPKPKEVKKTKTDEVIAQEEREKAIEKSEDSQLHNMYK